MWNSVRPEDINAGFRAASKETERRLNKRKSVVISTGRSAKDVLDFEISKAIKITEKLNSNQRMAKAIDKKLSEPDRSGLDKFMIGNSRFFFYRIRVVTSTLKNKKKKPKRVIDKKIPEHKKIKFVKDLRSNIERFTDFVWEEILPVTMSFHTALDDVENYALQVIDDRTGFNKDVLIKKAGDAVNLRIIRYLAEAFNLTEEEKTLFTIELRARGLPPIM